MKIIDKFLALAGWRCLEFVVIKNNTRRCSLKRGHKGQHEAKFKKSTWRWITKE